VLPYQVMGVDTALLRSMLPLQPQPQPDPNGHVRAGRRLLAGAGAGAGAFWPEAGGGGPSFWLERWPEPGLLFWPEPELEPELAEPAEGRLSPSPSRYLSPRQEP
jgi:hypothetical protein